MHASEHVDGSEARILASLVSHRRKGHAKTLALCEASFEVLPDLPDALRIGLFASPKTYSAYVRLSNASPLVQPDDVKDVRGLSIKLLHVPGEKIPESTEPRSQDFMLLSCPTLALGTAKLLRDSLRDSPTIFKTKMVVKGKWRRLKALSKPRIVPSSLLNIPFYSALPFAFGDAMAVKYVLRPTRTAPVPRVKPVLDDFLATQAQAQLHCEDVTFDFAIQVRRDTPEHPMPVEDASVRWSEVASPPVVVARLTLPRQSFRTAERAVLADKMVFDAAHALPAHRPIGSLHRAGIAMYEAERRTS